VKKKKGLRTLAYTLSLSFVELISRLTHSLFTPFFCLTYIHKHTHSLYVFFNHFEKTVWLIYPV
jgi:hypothetical protein